MRVHRWHIPAGLIAAISLALGVGLCTQPVRYSNTPSYANLIQIAPAQMWGAAYLVIGALLALYLFRPGRERYAIAVHTLAFVLYGAWLVAFIIRWLTDDHTTIVNVVSWTAYVGLVAFSASLIGLLQDTGR